MTLNTSKSTSLGFYPITIDVAGFASTLNLIIEVQERCPSELLKPIRGFPLSINLYEQRIIQIPRTFEEPIDPVRINCPMASIAIRD